MAKIATKFQFDSGLDLCLDVWPEYEFNSFLVCCWYTIASMHSKNSSSFDDFNIHVDNLFNLFASQFLYSSVILLTLKRRYINLRNEWIIAFNLNQLVSFSTNKYDHTLDIVMTLVHILCPTSSYVPHLCLHVWPSSLAPTHCSDSTQASHIDLPLAYWSGSQVFTWPYPPSSAISLYTHLTIMISLSHEQGLLWLRNAIIDPVLWNQLPPSTQSILLTDEPSASFRSLKTALFSLGLSHWKCFWLACTARSAI